MLGQGAQRAPSPALRIASITTWRRFGRRLRSLDGDKFDIEDKSRSGRNDAPGADVSVSKFCGNREAATSAHFHSENALIPAFDHLPGADDEAEGLPAAARAVELLAQIGRASCRERVLMPV